VLLFLLLWLFFRITDGTQRMPTISTNCSHAQMVHEVENELEEKFKLACLPEPKESAQYIIAHALGHKTVSFYVRTSITQNKLHVCIVYWLKNILFKVSGLYLVLYV